MSMNATGNLVARVTLVRIDDDPGCFRRRIGIRGEFDPETSTVPPLSDKVSRGKITEIEEVSGYIESSASDTRRSFPASSDTGRSKRRSEGFRTSESKKPRLQPQVGSIPSLRVSRRTGVSPAVEPSDCNNPRSSLDWQLGMDREENCLYELPECVKGQAGTSSKKDRVVPPGEEDQPDDQGNIKCRNKTAFIKVPSTLLIDHPPNHNRPSFGPIMDQGNLARAWIWTENDTDETQETNPRQTSKLPHTLRKEPALHQQPAPCTNPHPNISTREDQIPSTSGGRKGNTRINQCELRSILGIEPPKNGEYRNKYKISELTDMNRHRKLHAQRNKLPRAEVRLSRVDDMPPNPPQTPPIRPTLPQHYSHHPPPFTLFNKIRIMQLNMRRSSLVSHIVSANIKPKGFKILVLQEPYSVFRDGKHKIPYLGSNTRVFASEAAKPWAAIGITDPKYTVMHLSDLTTPHTVVIQVLPPDNFNFYVVAQYYQYGRDRDQYTNELEPILTRLTGQKIIIGADVNAESVLWSPRHTTGEGKKIEELIQRSHLTVVNHKTMGPTYFNIATGARSYIDLTLVTEQMKNHIGQWKTDDWADSDHKSLEYSIGTPTIADLNPRPPMSRFNLKRADWKKFSQTLKSLSSQKLETLEINNPTEAETAASTLTAIIYKASLDSIPRKTKFPQSHPYWNDELRAAKTQLYKLKRRIQKDLKINPHNPNNSQTLQLYNQERRIFRQKIEAAKEKSFKSFVTEEGNKNPHGIIYANLIRKRNHPRNVYTTIKTRDGYTSDMTSTANSLLDTHVPTDDPRTDSDELVQMKLDAISPPNTDDAPPFTITEIKYHAKTLKNNKAPGPDLIEPVILKRAVLTIPQQITRIYNDCLRIGVFPRVWKKGDLVFIPKGDKDPTDPRSFRPICLLPTIGKLFEKLIISRLNSNAFESSNFSQQQFGFMPDRSTEDAILEVKRIVEESKHNYVLGILFDIKGAFDNVQHATILIGLKQHNCPSNVYQVMRHYFQERSVRLKWPAGEITRQVSIGCAQGSHAGPPCWNRSFDPLLLSIEALENTNVVAYADDKIVLVHGNSRSEIETRTRRVTQIVDQWSRIAKLEISTSKTEAMYFKISHPKRAPITKNSRKDRPRKTHALKKPRPMAGRTNIKTDNYKINIKDQVTYLGVRISEGMRFHTHPRFLRSKIIPTLHQLRKLAQNVWGLSQKTSMIIYKTVFIPTLTYAAAAWASSLTAHELRELESIQYTALLAVTQAYRGTSTRSQCVIAGTPPAKFLLERHKARFHIRKGRTINLFDERISPGKDALQLINGAICRQWQRDWQTEGEQRLREGAPKTTYAFLQDISDRLRSTWLAPDQNTIQLLSGTGCFRESLHQRGLAPDGTCECGGLDTAEHLLLDCPIYEDERGTLIQMATARLARNREWQGLPPDPLEVPSWPSAVQIFVSDQDVFKLFASFCKVTLRDKFQKDLTRQITDRQSRTCTHSSTESYVELDSEVLFDPDYEP